jgi:O-antigen ligase
MLILLLIIPFLFIKEDFVLKKYWLVIIIIPVFLTLFLTSSRNALLGLFAGLIIIGFLKNKKFLLIFLSAVILFLLFAPMGLKDRILSIVDMNHPSNQSRFIMWKTGLKIIKDYFWLGIGDSDLLLIYKNYKIPQFHGEGVHLHNNFFQIFLTLGVIGFVSYMLMMIYLIYRQIKIYIKTKSSSILNIIAVSSLACMTAFQVSGLTEWNFGDFEFAALLWFTLGLAFLSEKLYNQGADGKA